MLRPPLTTMSLLMRKLVEILAVISISPNAYIGRSFHVSHCHGIFINSGAMMGDDCGIMDGVAIGSDKTRGVPSHR
jgi:serine acetyltransferase